MCHYDNQTTYWDSVTWKKTFSIPLDPSAIQSFGGSDLRILDFGCGYGRICGELWNLGFRNIVGVDSSPEMIKRAHQEHPDVHFELLEDGKLPYPDGSFDVVVLIAVLTCIPSNAGQMKLIADLHRVLRSGGLLYISDYPIQDDERDHDFLTDFGVEGVFRLPDGGIVRHHDMGWIRSLTSNFTIQHLTEMQVMTMNGNQAKAFSYLGTKE